MSVQIDLGTYRLESYTYGWTVGERRIRGEEAKNAGEDYLAGQTFHSTLTQALKALQERTLRDSDATTLEELRDEMDRFRSDLTRLMDLNAYGPKESKPRRRKAGT